MTRVPVQKTNSKIMVGNLVHDDSSLHFVGSDCGGGRKCATGLCTSEDDQCKSAGASMGLTSACDMGGDDTCLVTCNSPQGSGCVRLQTPLRDGSQCGYGGTCESG